MSPLKFIKKNSGFTLLEILIALFIFTILSMILVGALRSVIDAEAGAEKSAERLHTLQIAMLIIARDIEQTVNRPVLNAGGSEEAALMGSAQSMVFTHSGFINPMGLTMQSSLQRTAYYVADHALWRMNNVLLDVAPESKPVARKLLSEVTSIQFQYLAQDKRFYNNWPLSGQTNQPLPRAVRLFLTIQNWGTISQLYVISAQSPDQTTPPTPPTPSKP